MIEYPTMGVEDILDVMESFDSIAPLPVKYGEIVFLCNCKGAYNSYVCLESAVLSCMFNPELEIPDIARLKQLKDRQKKALANPFNAKQLRAKSIRSAKVAVKNVRPVEETRKVDQPAPAADTITSNEERLLKLAMEKSLAKVSTFAV